MEPNPDAADDRRQRPDRRTRPTQPWDGLFTPARRTGYRRGEEQDRFVIVDRHDLTTVLLVVSLLLLTVLDGAITLILVNSHCEEANPLMAPLVEWGALPFLAIKYALTACGLPVLLVYKNHRMFGSRFRVGHVLPVLVGMYLMLIAYQFTLLHVGPPRPSSPQYASSSPVRS